MNVIKFQAPVNARAAEADIVEAIKVACYAYAGVVSVAQVLGCLEIAKAEILAEANQ